MARTCAEALCGCSGILPTTAGRRFRAQCHDLRVVLAPTRSLTLLPRSETLPGGCEGSTVPFPPLLSDSLRSEPPSGSHPPRAASATPFVPFLELIVLRRVVLGVQTGEQMLLRWCPGSEPAGEDVVASLLLSDIQCGGSGVRKDVCCVRTRCLYVVAGGGSSVWRRVMVLRKRGIGAEEEMGELSRLCGDHGLHRDLHHDLPQL